MATGSLYGSSSESTGLYGIGAASGGTYFEWFIFQDSATAPANPTGGSWSFSSNTGVAPTGWVNSPPPAPVNQVWVSIAVVDSRNATTLVWSTPGLMTGSGLPILTGSGVPSSGTGLNGQLYINTATTPQSLYNKQAGAWVQLTGSTLYALAGANTNITSLTGITGAISTPTSLQLSTTGGGGDAVAKLHWNSTFGGPTIGLAGGNTNLQIGQDEFVYVHNNTGLTITKGQVVYISGSQGQRLTVALARANADATSISVVGFANENIANNADGFVATVGLVSGINTNGFADGASIWLSPTVAGGFTTTKPVAPNHLVLLGYVVKGGSAGAGSIYVFTQNGYELDELHDVLITSVANNNLLRYNSAVPAWVNIAGPSGTIVGTTDTQTLTNKSISGSANTLTNIPNSALVYDSVNVNGVDLTLGAVQLLGPNWILPSYVGNAGKVLAVNPSASDVQWISAGGVGTVTSVDVSGGTTGLSYSGGPITAAGTMTLQGVLNITNGGTGQTTANAAFNALAPLQTGNSGKYLTTNGTDTSWAANPLGTVTSVGGTGTVSGITLTGTVTTSGNLTLGGTLNLSAYNGAGSFTTLTTSSTVTHNGGTANGVAYLNGSKVLTTGSALTFDGTKLSLPTILAIKGAQNSNVAKIAMTRTDQSWSINNETDLRIYGQNTDTESPSSIAHSMGNTGIFVWNNASTASEQMRLTSTGLGIGTSSPAGRVHAVNTYTNTSDATIIAGGNIPGINLRANAGARMSMFSNYATADSTSFLTGTGGANPSSEVLRFDHSNGNVLALAGNVGIGTSSPQAKLEVGGAGQLYINQDQRLEWNIAGSTTIRANIRGTSGNALVFGNRVGGTLTDTMTLDGSGNLGLGVTPSAWGSTYRALQIAAGSGAVSSRTDAFRFFASTNAYNDNTNWRYGASTFASLYEQGDSTHKWFTAPSGTAGAAITFTQAMTLHASGGLSVGSTTDPGAGNVSVGSNKFFGLDSNAKYVPDDASVGGALYTGGGLRFFTGGANERARIDSSGNLLVGTTASGGQSGFAVLKGGSGIETRIEIAHNFGTASGVKYVDFLYATGSIGSITQNGTTAVAYNTSSDYRLKNITGPITNSGAYIDSLNPVEGTWKADGSTFVGLIAHEVQEASRTTVATGVKDGEEMQGMDYSSAEIIANLIAEVKSLRQRLAAANL